MSVDARFGLRGPVAPIHGNVLAQNLCLLQGTYIHRAGGGLRCTIPAEVVCSELPYGFDWRGKAKSKRWAADIQVQDWKGWWRHMPSIAHAWQTTAELSLRIQQGKVALSACKHTCNGW
jgi:hypothetical protein